MMKLISEDINSKVEVLTENTKNGKQLYIEGIFAQADVVNGNNRIYPSQVLFPEVEMYIESFVNKKLAVGELEHPDYPAPNLNYASHLITDLRIEGKNVIGKAKILDTEKGKTARALLEGGVRLGVSTRGLASLNENENGISEVNDDFKLFAVDIVGNPSAPDAFVNGVMESIDWFVHNGVIKRKELKKTLTESQKLSIVKKILKTLTK